jgi:nucleosome binding factor SPN SPT16 subunit
MKDLDMIQDWLNDVEITYTVGRATMAWNDVRKVVKELIEDGSFYTDVDPDGVKKPPGWLFLGADEGDEEEEDEDDDESSFEADSADESESDDYSDSDDESSYEEEDSDSEYADDDLSEEGKVINFYLP